MSTDRIDKQIEINAPVARVWQALTDHQQFGQWFRVVLEQPFVPGQVTRGRTTYPGYEHVKFAATVVQLDPTRRFAFTWHPFAVEPGVDYSQEKPTLVEFELQPTSAGTLLKVSESGFDQIPAHRRAAAYRSHTGGWEEQLQNIRRYVDEQ